MSQLTDVKRFLSRFNPGTRLVKNTLLYSNGKLHMKSAVLGEVLNENDRGADAYFVVNPGGTKEQDIKKLVACFVDLDAGRDTNGKYYDGRTLLRRKQKMKVALNTFHLPPSLIVETRNGFQAYWLLSNTSVNKVRLNRWNTAQKKINAFFRPVGADTKVVKCNQIMRLPFTTWNKKWEHKKPVSVRLIRNVSKKYKISELVNFTDKLPKDVGFITAEAYKHVSYEKTWQGVKDRPISKAYKSGKEDLGVVIETISFLRDVNYFLWGKGSKYMAKQANSLAANLTKEFGVS